MKIRTKSFKFKLWLYFVFFTAMIFSVLWLLQTVFLQSFYNAMVISNTKKAAQQIVSDSSQENITEIIDKLSHDNSMLVYITNEKGEILYSSDEFKEIHNRIRGGSGDKKDAKSDLKGRHSVYRELPELYDEFLEKLRSSENGVVDYETGSLYVYGTYIDYYGSEERAILYVSATIDAVSSSVTIISMQLVWVTILSLIVGFVLSWFIARKFASPVDSLSEKAKKLGEKDYTPEFRKGFCAELDELSDTLDKTNEKLNRSRSFQMELLANVSHDLRTPLTMIKGYAEMIRDISREDEQQCAEDVSVIIKETDRLTALVNEILEYSEMQTDTVKEEFTPVDLSRLLKRVSDSFESLYRSEQYVFERKIPENIMVKGNSSRLERAVFNLLDNAVRHTGDSKKVRITLTVEHHKAVIAITDFGSGIPAAELSHIWDRYYTSRQRKGGGVSGLGLAIVRQITERHGGCCSVQTETGKGSTFLIELPLSD